MRRTIALTAACLLALTACGTTDGDSEAAATRTSAASSTSASASPVDAPLGETDVYACQKFVADQTEAYEWLTRLVRDGTIPADEGFGGKLQVYNMGGFADLIGSAVENPELRTALDFLVDEQPATRAALDGGTFDPYPTLEALEDAAAVCEEGGFVIDWHDA
jgi:hypothetical protein